MNRLERRKFKSQNKETIQAANERKKDFEVQARTYNLWKLVMVVTPSRSMLGFSRDVDIKSFTEFISLHFWFKSYLFGKVK